MVAGHGKREGQGSPSWDFHVASEENPGPRHLDIIQEKIFQANIGLRVEPISDATFALKTRICVMPAASFVLNSISGCRLDRSGRFLSEKDDDDLLLIHTMNGQLQLNCGSRECVAPAGRHFLLSMAERMTIANIHPAVRQTVKLKRRPLEALIGRVDDHILRPMDDNSPAFRLMWAYVDALTAPSAVRDPYVDQVACGHIYDLAALALGGPKPAVHVADNAGVRAARLVRIKADICENLHDSNISLAWISNRHGISVSYVKRLFEQAETSFTEFVLSERLKRAHTLLSLSACAGQSITDIAFACGFGDLSYFNRSFRRRFGGTPGEVRRAEPGRRLS
jgi:AraC-like DNA-binding protein